MHNIFIYLFKKLPRKDEILRIFMHSWNRITSSEAKQFLLAVSPSTRSPHICPLKRVPSIFKYTVLRLLDLTTL